VVGASDIHMVPDNNLVRIYYRIDGVLHQMYLFAKRFQQPLVTRYKIMAEMDISNPNIAHDGRIKYESNVGAFDIRVSTFPTQLGETVVMRLLIYSKVVGDLENLGLEPKIWRVSRRPSTGPTVLS
jgi:type IV pilus assembly protein PilB